MHHISSELHS